MNILEKVKATGSQSLNIYSAEEKTSSVFRKGYWRQKHMYFDFSLSPNFGERIHVNCIGKAQLFVCVSREKESGVEPPAQ